LAKFARRVVALLLAGGVVLGLVALLLPAEKVPPAGRWLSRVGLEPRTLSLPRGSGRIDIRYVRKGQGPTLILIHGLASSVYTWSDVIGPLSQSFDVIALDLPGFGGSSQPADLAFEDLPKTVTGLMDALGVRRAHLAGNSLGGAVSLLLAARQPQRVDRVVILDSAGFRMKPNERPFIFRFLGSRAAGVIGDGLPIRRFLTGITLRRLFRDQTRVTGERIDEYAAPLLRQGALASARALLQSSLDERFEADLGSIEARTLVVWGRFDPWLPQEDADRFVAAIKGSRKVIVETGHMPQEEKPADLARLIGEFLLS